MDNAVQHSSDGHMADDDDPRIPVGVDWSSVSLSSDMHQTLRSAKRNTTHEKISVYEGFGSFHSENVEDLISLSDANYTAPRNRPLFARRVFSRHELEQLGVMKFMDHANLSGAGKNTTATAGHKRSRTDHSSGGYPSPSTIGPVALSSTSASDHDDGATGSTGSGDGCAAAPPSDGSDGDDNKPQERNAIALAAGTGQEELLQRLLREPLRRCAMGREFRESHFMIDPQVTFINHGAFGSSLLGGSAIKRGYEDRMECEVVEFVDRELLPLIVYSIRSLSRFLKADPRQIVLLQNATFGLNCAMKLIEKDDVVAFLDTEYLSVYKMMWFRCHEVGATHHELALSRFLHDEAVMGSDAAVAAEIVRQLPAGCTTVIVDCITSTSALCLPIFSHIVPALRKHGVSKIIVDGAHSPLQVDLNFLALPPESQPTIFVGNLHKWFSSPKSVGFFWVRAEDAERLHSVVLSHGAGDGLLSEFIWDGTRDYGAYLSIPALVDFWEAQGLARVRRYCTELLSSASKMLTTAFRSRAVARHSPFMSLVELPEELQDEFVTAKYIQDLLHDVYAIEVPVKRVEGRYYVRISAFVYNTPVEYLYLKEAMLDIADRWFHSNERRELCLAANRTAEARIHQQTLIAGDGTATETDSHGNAVPCDERIRRQGGCGVSGLDPSLKRKKTRKF